MEFMELYKKSEGKGLAFKNGVIYEAMDSVPDDEILTFHQIKGMIIPEQMYAIVKEFAYNHEELELCVTEKNFMEIAEKYYDSVEIRGSIIYMMTFADGDVAVRCVGYEK